MTLLILCVMLCIVGPLPKVSAFSSSDLDGKVENLESKLEAMSTIILRLIEENEKLKAMADNVPRLIRENEKLETIVDTLPKLMKENEKLGIMVHTVIKNNELLRNRVDVLEQLVQDNVASNDEAPDTTDDKDEMSKEEEVKEKKNGVMTLPDKHKMQDEEEDSKETYYRIQQNRKRILGIEPPTSPTTSLVAFHAYLSQDSAGPLSAHHILKYDSVSLNKGQGYNAYDGIFIAPTSGTYVFTWSIMSEGHGNVFSQLMKNSDIVGTRFADSSSDTDWSFSTGIVVVDVNQGDHVYVRLGRASIGNVGSVVYSRSTFSGWILN